MREHMEPLGVRTSIEIHLADEGQTACQVYPAQGRAVIALETTVASVARYLDARNLDRMRRVIAEAQAALAAPAFGSIGSTGSTGSTGPAESLASAGKAA